MIINSETTYTMYLEAEEFELLYSLTKELDYQHSYNEEENEYIIIVSEDTLYDMKDKLDYASYVEEYEEYNSFQANRINSLIADISAEL